MACTRLQCKKPVRLSCRCGAGFCTEACFINAWHAGHKRDCPHAEEILNDASKKTQKGTPSALLCSAALSKTDRLQDTDAASLNAPDGTCSQAALPSSSVDAHLLDASDHTAAKDGIGNNSPSQAVSFAPACVNDASAPKNDLVPDTLRVSGKSNMSAKSTCVMSTPQDSRAGSSTTEASQAEPRTSMGKFAPPARDSLDDFKAVEEKAIGSGSFGRVRKVAHRRTQECYAMKTMGKVKLQEMNMMPYVLREIETQFSVQHPHILRLFQCFEDAENLHLLLEYASGGSLYQVMKKRRGTLSDHEAGPIFAGIASALDHLHHQMIIHRDVKPENILMCAGQSGPIAKLADFGWCAKNESAFENRGTFCGTLDYLAPEMIHGEPHNSSVDNWAMGVLLFEILVGDAPWGKSQWEVTQRIGKVDLKIPSDVPTTASDLIRKLLVRRPADRLPLAEALRHPWVKANAPSFQPDCSGSAGQARGGSTGLLGEVSPAPQSLIPCNSLPLDSRLETSPPQPPKSWEQVRLVATESPEAEDVRLGTAATPQSHQGSWSSSSHRRAAPGQNLGTEARIRDVVPPAAETDARCGSLLHRIDLEETEDGESWRRRMVREGSGSPVPSDTFSRPKMRGPSGFMRSPEGSVASSCAHSCASESASRASDPVSSQGRTWKETNTYEAICAFVSKGPVGSGSRREKHIESVSERGSGSQTSGKGLCTPQRLSNATEAGPVASGPALSMGSSAGSFDGTPRRFGSDRSAKVARSISPDECISPLHSPRTQHSDKEDNPKLSTGSSRQAATFERLETLKEYKGGRISGFDKSPTRLSEIKGLGDKMGDIRAQICGSLDDLDKTLAGRFGQERVLADVA